MVVTALQASVRRAAEHYMSTWFATNGMGSWIVACAAAPALPDGGELMGDLYKQIDDSAWKTLNETVFALAGKD